MLNPPFHMLVVGMTACGKTHYLLQMLEREFKGVFDYVFLVCPTFLENRTYQDWRYLADEKVIAIPCEQDDVDEYLETIVSFAKNTNSLIVLDDCASGRDIKNRTSEIVKLAFHGRHIGLSTVVITQQLTSVAKPYRMNVSKVVFFYTARKDDRKDIFENYLDVSVPLHAPRSNLIKMLTNREKTLMVVTFCFAFCFALFVLVYPFTAFLVISLVVKNIS